MLTVPLNGAAEWTLANDCISNTLGIEAPSLEPSSAHV